MRVVIAGGHGKIALLLARLLSDRGDSVAGLIRDPAQAQDLTDAGAEPLIVDLETAAAPELASHLHGADAVVFAAGAGPGSGIARKQTVDRDGAILLADAAEAAGVTRYVMISSMGAGTYGQGVADPVFAVYLRAKAEADDAVRSRSALRSTIVRPGRLTDDAATGRVHIADVTGRGSIPRHDVATVLAAVLDLDGTAGQTFEVISGDVPVASAVENLTQR